MIIEGFYETDALLHQDLRDYDPFQRSFSVWDRRNRSWQEWSDFLGLRAQSETLQDFVKIMSEENK